MSDKDDRTPIPVLRKATSDLKKATRNEMSFDPNDFQERVKSRFFRRLEELSHKYDKETVFSSPDLTVQLAGTDRILKWLEDPAFASWFVDEDFLVDTLASLKAPAVDLLKQSIRNEDAHLGDRLKAVRMLFELTDSFPGRKQEVRFLDDRLNSLSESETDREIKKLRATLGRDDEEQTDNDNGETI